MTTLPFNSVSAVLHRRCRRSTVWPRNDLGRRRGVVVARQHRQLPVGPLGQQRRPTSMALCLTSTRSRRRSPPTPTAPARPLPAGPVLRGRRSPWRKCASDRRGMTTRPVPDGGEPCALARCGGPVGVHRRRTGLSIWLRWQRRSQRCRRSVTGPDTSTGTNAGSMARSDLLDHTRIDQQGVRTVLVKPIGPGARRADANLGNHQTMVEVASRSPAGTAPSTRRRASVGPESGQGVTSASSSSGSGRTAPPGRARRCAARPPRAATW